MSIGRIPTLLILALTLATVRPEAQTVRGELVERTNGVPIDAAFVVLLDSAGHEVARTLTHPGGTFLLHAPVAGTYRLKSKRIGFQPTESSPFPLAQDQTVGYRLEAQAVPVRLPAVLVRGRPQCGMKEDAAAVAQLWDETREALAAVKWTEQQNDLVHTVERFDRELPRSGRRVVKERHMAWAGFGERPFKSIPAEQLAQRGYVVAGANGMVDYYGPDADVLLGDFFLNTHCFGVRDGGAEHPGLVGLAFEPAPGRKVPEVAGVLWLDQSRLTLQSLEFTYTRLRDASLGGHVEFATLPSGVWIVKDWFIRTARTDTTISRRRPPRVLGYRETGGVVSTIASASGEVLYSGTEANLDGVVVDSSRGGEPLAGAVVVLRGTDRADTANARGAFQIRGSLDGEYVVSFRHPWLDSLGIDPDEQPVRLVPGGRATVTLFVPTEADVIRELCPNRLDDGAWIIVGVVRDSASGKVPDAQVQVQLAGRKAKGAGATDAEGRFVVCGVPAGSLTVTVTAGAGQGAVTVELGTARVSINGDRRGSPPGRIVTQEIRLRH